MPANPILDILQQRFGIAAEAAEPRLPSALRDRMAVCGASSEAEYARRISADEEECLALFEEVAAIESWFYRDVDPFRMVASFGRRRISSRPGRPLRVLAIGCARGEEVFTAAMALQEAGVDTDSYRIEGCDVSVQAIRGARDACYGEAVFCETERRLRDRYFLDEGEFWTAGPALRESVEFFVANVFDLQESIDAGTYDIVLCRNVIHQCCEAAARQVVETVEHLLAPEGLLIVGRDEALPEGDWPLRAGLGGGPFAYFLDPDPAGAAGATATVSTTSTPDVSSAQHAVASAFGSSATHGSLDDALAAVEHAMESRQFVSAFSIAEAAVECFDADARAFTLLGRAAEASDRMVDAIEGYRRALLLDPCFADALQPLCDLLRSEGYEQAAQRLKEEARERALPGASPRERVSR